MNLDQLVKLIKNTKNGYQQMTGGKINPAQAFHVGETVAKDVNMTPLLNLPNLVRANGGTVHYIDYAQFKSFWDNNINIFENSIFVHDENNFDIILPIYAPLVENRYTIAHELGHYALHSNIGKCFALRKGDGDVEKEADCFALGFLLPTEKFNAVCQQSNKNIGELSTMFLVPDDIIEARVKLLELS